MSSVFQRNNSVWCTLLEFQGKVLIISNSLFLWVNAMITNSHMICEWYQSLILKLQYDLHVLKLYASVDLSAINCVSLGKSPSAWNHTLCNCLWFHNCDFMIFSIYRHVHMTYSRRLKLCHYSVNILTGSVVSILCMWVLCDIIYVIYTPGSGILLDLHW